METRLREDIVDVALELAEQSSWEAVRLYDVANRLGVTLDDIRQFYREKEDLVDAWFDRADQAMLSTADSRGFTELSPRRRLYRLITAWLNALAPHRQVTRQMIHGKLEPGHIHVQIPGLLRVSRTVQWMREAAHRDATYARRALEETGLTSIYLITFFHWLHDNSPNYERTTRLLECCLARAEQLDRLVYGYRDRADTVAGSQP